MSVPFRLAPLPDTYRAADLEVSLRALVRSIDERFRRLERSPAPPPPAPADQLPDEPVVMDIARDETLDRWVSSTVASRVYRGPGRVWRARSWSAPKIGDKPRAVRYRFAGRQAEFTPISCRMVDRLRNASLDGAMSRWEVTYGIVVTGIPNLLGRKPSRLTIASEHLSGSVAAVTGTTPGWMTNTRAFFEPAALTEFSDGDNHVFADKGTSHGAPANGWMHPSTTGPSAQSTRYVSEIEGLSAQLITGQTATEVYAQMNSLDSPNLATIRGRARGLGAIAPGAEATNGLAPANCTVVGSSTTLTARTYSTLLGSDYVVEGVPFRYQDCSRLRYTGDYFSVAITVDQPRLLESYEVFQASGIAGSPTGDMQPGAWWTAGLLIDSGDDRDPSFDIILE